jgi:hypothetical protein
VIIVNRIEKSQISVFYYKLKRKVSVKSLVIYPQAEYTSLAVGVTAFSLRVLPQTFLLKINQKPQTYEF